MWLLVVPFLLGQNITFDTKKDCWDLAIAIKQRHAMIRLYCAPAEASDPTNPKYEVMEEGL